MPAQSTYTAIATTTLGSSSTTIDFNNIPQDYTDLFVVCFVRGTAAATTVNLLVRVNNNSGNIYDGAVLRGTGTSAVVARYNDTSYAAPVGTIPANNATANTYSLHLLTELNYTTTNRNKTFNSFTAGEYSTAGNVEQVVNQFFSTGAITRLTFLCSSGDLQTGSVITLYGIKAA